MAATDTQDGKFSFLMDVYSSVVFLTRLPAPGWPEAAARKLSDGMWAFPVAGVLVATIAGVVYAICDAFGVPAFISALFAVSALVIATGGLHEDGLSDLADGVWGGADSAKRLAIMSDSRIGAFGAIALIVSITGRAAAIATIGQPLFVLGALIAVAAGSRAVMPAMMIFGTPAKSDGLGASAGQPALGAWGGALVLGALICAIAAPAGWVACLVAAAVGAVLVGCFAHRNIGGYTGDVLGAGQQVAELFALTAIASAIAATG